MNNERNIIQVETTNFEKQEIKQPLLSLTCGRKDSVSITAQLVLLLNWKLKVRSMFRNLSYDE